MRYGHALALALVAGTMMACETYGPYRDNPSQQGARGIASAPVFSDAPPPESIRILVLSDIHGYDRETLVRSQAVWNFHLLFWGKSQDTDFRYTKKILEAARDRRDIDLVILPGDLTVDGELASHRVLLGLLEDFRAARPELPILVIPGNHDVNSPQARRHSAIMTLPTKSLSPGGFASLYGDFGYARALARDSASLSYAVEPIPGLVVLALDTASWYKNLFFPIRLSATRGIIRETTLAWIDEILAEARAAGKTVIAVQHHPPDSLEATGKPGLENSAALLELYRRHGIAFFVAGHRHSFSFDLEASTPWIIAPSVASSPGRTLLVSLDASEVRVQPDPLGLGPD